MAAFGSIGLTEQHPLHRGRADALARARPAFTHSRIISRSNSAYKHEKARHAGDVPG